MFKPLRGYLQALQTRRDQNYNFENYFTGEIQISDSLFICDTKVREIK
jgi:hypothetical protein